VDSSVNVGIQCFQISKTMVTTNRYVTVSKQRRIVVTT